MPDFIKRAIITKGGKDDTARPVQQLEYFGKTSEAEIIFPYGIHANLPKDSLLVVFPILNQTSNHVAMGGLPNERIQVEEGEVVFFHPLTKAKIYFKNNGDIEIDTLEKDIKITCNNASIAAQGDVNLTASGEFNVDVPTTNWNGDIIQSGTLTNDQTTSNGVPLGGHNHDKGTYLDAEGRPLLSGDSGVSKAP